MASIGRSITIRGEVSGDEDLLIEGRVDGSVDLEEHSVTVGPEGQVKAGISGRVVTIEGSVNGDLRASEVVVLRSSARVQGDITAPRVVLEDGATFRGGVDMGDGAGQSATQIGASQRGSALKPPAPPQPTGAAASEKASGDQGGADGKGDDASGRSGAKETAGKA